MSLLKVYILLIVNVLSILWAHNNHHMDQRKLDRSKLQSESGKHAC